MVAERITVGVYALDQVVLPTGGGPGGWAAKLAKAEPVLDVRAAARTLSIRPGTEGWELSETVDLGGSRHHAGAGVVVDPVERRPGLFLIRIGGKASAVASAIAWTAGTAHRPVGAVQPDALAAFAAGTLIDTPDGPRAVETLTVGETVTTLANGSRPLRWVGQRRATAVEMLAYPGLCPVEFTPGSIGNRRTLRISQQQRILIDDWRAAVYFGEDRVLVAAQALVDDHAARVVFPVDGVDYVILLCDRHEVLLAEGALSESFHPGEGGLEGLDTAARAAIAAVVPEADLTRRRAAFPIVRNAEARALRTLG